MYSYAIITDVTCDLPKSFFDEYDVDCFTLMLNINGKSYNDYFGEVFSRKEFYDSMRAGSTPTTTQANAADIAAIAEKHLSAGQDVIIYTISSGVSGTINSARVAADDLSEKYPGRKIHVCDLRCCSLGHGLMIYEIANQRKNGATFEEAVAFSEERSKHMHHWFTVDDLVYLKRGGRVSAAAAVFGSILGIKPVLNCNSEGRLVPRVKTRGRKKAIETLLAKMDEHGVDINGQTVAISHGDCPDDAELLAGMIRAKYTVKDIIINYVGSVIGAHSGPGTLALFFFGDERTL